MRIFIYGSSDDLVEIDGDADGCDEYGFYNEKPTTGYIATSDGSILTIAYAPDGTACWRVTFERKGAATCGMWQVGDESEEMTSVAGCPPYSDVAYLSGDIKWVKFCGRSQAKAYAAIEQPLPAR